jgi:hypothetical protein
MGGLCVQTDDDLLWRYISLSRSTGDTVRLLCHQYWAGLPLYWCMVPTYKRNLQS